MSVDRRDPADIFSDALELPVEERRSFVERECGDDVALRDEVLSLLAMHPRARRGLHTEVLNSEVAGVASELEDPMIGRRVGAYRILELIDTGGMGAVYLGERSDEEFDKRVAIKVFRAALRGDVQLERFRTERQVLANLEHAHIARLIDGGASPEGAPYIVMEYVDGVPLDEYAAANRLDVRDRLRLFLSVCDAIAYAHRNLVIHRDLKPANILVDRDGAPRVLDFGIAKIMNPDGSAGERTVTQHRMMTPRYASPEQMRGEATSTATDVYSLGVVLYELLTGCHPNADRTTTDWELAHAITTREPTRPSLAASRSRMADEQNTSPRALTRRLKGDLDTIVLKALDKSPARRYPSVAELAQDIERHLAGETVRARPKTAGYRLSRFVRRNKVVTASLTSVFVMLVVGLIATTTQYRRAEERTREATWQAYTARLTAAESAIRSNQMEAAELSLARAPESLRGWEWDHVHARLDRSRHAFAAHDHWITALAFSPDGRTLASASYDQTVKVWDVTAAPHLRHTLRRNVAPSDDPAWLYGALSLDFTADGRHLAAGYVSGRDRGDRDVGDAVVVWDAASGEMIDGLDHYRIWAEVDCAPLGNRIAVGSSNGLVEIHAGRLNSVVAEFRASIDPGREGFRVYDVAWHPRENLIAAARSKIEVWNLDSASLVQTYPSMGDGFMWLAYDATGERLAGVTRLGQVVAWDTATMQPMTIFDGHDGAVDDVVFTAGGDEAISVGSDGRVLAWNPGDGAVHAVLRGHQSPVKSVALHPDDRTLATGDEAGMIRIWDRLTDDIPTLRVEQEWRASWAEAAIPTPDGSSIITAGTNWRVELWDCDGRSAPRRLEELDVAGASRLAMSDSGNALLVANEHGFVTLTDFATRRMIRVFPAHEDAEVYDVALADDGRRFATVGTDTLLKVWVAADPPVCRNTIALPDLSTTIAFVPGGGPLLTGDNAGRVFIRDPDTGAVVREIHAHDDAVTDLVASPDASMCATTSKDGTVKLWRLPHGTAIATVVASKRFMHAVAFARDGQRLFAAGRDATIRVIDPVRGREIVRLGGHSHAILGLSTGADGLLVSTSRDGTVRLWEPRDPRPTAERTDHPVIAAARAPTTRGEVEAWWKGEHNANDEVGMHHGLLQNGAGFAPGHHGDAFRFNGGTNVVRIDDLPPSMGVGRSFTVALWARPDSVSASYPYGTIVSHRGDWRTDNVHEGWKLQKVGNRWALGQRFNPTPYLYSDAEVVPDEFTHLAVAFDMDARQARMYVNGEVQPGILEEVDGSPWTNQGALRLGRDAFDDGTLFDPFTGLIDEVKVFAGVLTPEEIRALYLEDING